MELVRIVTIIVYLIDEYCTLDGELRLQTASILWRGRWFIWSANLHFGKRLLRFSCPFLCWVSDALMHREINWGVVPCEARTPRTITQNLIRFVPHTSQPLSFFSAVPASDARRKSPSKSGRKSIAALMSNYIWIFLPFIKYLIAFKRAIFCFRKREP